MPRRVAFLIGNQAFLSDSESKLLPLQCPRNDVAALSKVLEDPQRGGFEVHRFLDDPSFRILPLIHAAMNDADPDDFILIFYSGHGILDRSGRVCLATSDTMTNALISTAIPTRTLSEMVEQSDCGQVVMLLDCCYSGAIGLRGTVNDALSIDERASGFYIMTASTSLQVARESSVTQDGVVMGVFTSALVDGIETGAADSEQRGKITISDLRRYLSRTVRGSTPQFFDLQASGDPLISFNPQAVHSCLEPKIVADLSDPLWFRRRGAVLALAAVIREDELPVGEAAKKALQKRLDLEIDARVAIEIRNVLSGNHHAMLDRLGADTPEEIGQNAPLADWSNSAVQDVDKEDRHQKCNTKDYLSDKCNVNDSLNPYFLPQERIREEVSDSENLDGNAEESLLFHDSKNSQTNGRVRLQVGHNSTGSELGNSAHEVADCSLMVPLPQGSFVKVHEARGAEIDEDETERLFSKNWRIYSALAMTLLTATITVLMLMDWLLTNSGTHNQPVNFTSPYPPTKAGAVTGTSSRDPPLKPIRLPVTDELASPCRGNQYAIYDGYGKQNGCGPDGPVITPPPPDKEPTPDLKPPPPTVIDAPSWPCRANQYASYDGYGRQIACKTVTLQPGIVCPKNKTPKLDKQGRVIRCEVRQ